MKNLGVIKSLGVILVILAILVLPLLQVRIAQAAAVTNHKDTLSRTKVSVDANHEWQFVSPSGVDATTDTIVYEFDVAGTTFDLTGVVLGDIDLLEDTDTTPGDCAGTLTQEVLVSADTAATDEWLVTIDTTADTITVGPAAVNDTAATTAANACVILRVGTNATGGTDQINNPATAGSYRMGITGAFGDTGEATVTILADDQVAVSATVAQSLTFSISDTTIGFGTLSSTASRYATGDLAGSATEGEAHTLIASTNSGAGYTITVDGNTLTSGSYTITAIGPTNTAPATGTEQYGLRMTASGGSGTVSAPYAAAGFALDTAAFPDEVASATGASADTTYSVRYVANIAGNTEAGSYTSTLTYIATGNF